ncbi:MAG: YqjF family protein [Natrialbaceae archaeon]
MDVLEMRWEDVWFAHWAVEPAVVASALPDSLAVDTYDGEAYLGVVGFRMEEIRPRGLPAGLSFPELNLRTYVDGPNGPGVYFFSLDADDRIGVPLARRLFRLPYYRAEMAVSTRGSETRFSSRRTHAGVPPANFEATYRVSGEPTLADPGSLAAFLTERYRFYVTGGGGRTYAGSIDHPPWRLGDLSLDIATNDLFAANGFDRPAGEPHLLYSPGIDVTAGVLRPA